MSGALTPQKNEGRGQMFIRLAMFALALAVTVMWAQGVRYWWRQHRIINTGNTVQAEITDVRFLSESKNQKYCTFEISYSYITPDAGKVNAKQTVPVPGPKVRQKSSEFLKAGQLFKAGKAVEVYLSPDSPDENIFSPLRHPGKTVASLGMAVAALWVLFAVNMWRLHKRSKAAD